MSTPVNLHGGAKVFYGTISRSSSGVVVTHNDSVTGIRVISLFVVATTAVTVLFYTSTGTTAVTGAMPFGANGGCVLPYNPAGWFETAAGDDLGVTLGSGVAIAGGLSYVLVRPTVDG